jgi:nucleotide-binding universal stress UspA family protein
MTETILVATDGSATALSAERYAVSLASRLPARLRGVTVIEDKLAAGLRAPRGDVPPPALEGLEAFLKARADAICRRFSERARAAGLDAPCESVQGAADDVIAARGAEVDVIVVGRDGEHKAQRTALIGSTADAVIRKATRSVLVVPEGAELVGGILLAFDGSVGSRVAARVAVELGTKLREPTHLFVDSKDKGRSIARFDEVRKLLGQMPVPGREVSSTLGRPDVKIVDTARQLRVGLIVMGAYGRNRITEYFLGSNAAAVVRTSPIAVLLVR